MIVVLFESWEHRMVRWHEAREITTSMNWNQGNRKAPSYHNELFLSRFETSDL